jgi:small-conductance mechanosensitive channel
MYPELLINYKSVFVILASMIGISFIYFVLGQIIKNSRMANNQKRRTLSNLRTFLFITVSISMLVVYAQELYQIVLSLAAIGAGCAIAFKEVFLCIGGGFYRAFAHPFSVGDRIEINDIRGDVIDIGLMATQLLEVGPKDYTHQFTGRTVSIPNSLVLTQKVINESATAHEITDFVLHIFRVPIKNDNSWQIHHDQLLESANEVCEKYIKDATTFFEQVAKKRSVDVPWVEPRINIKFSSNAELDLMVRVTVPVKMKGRVEQSILNTYLTKTH